MENAGRQLLSSTTETTVEVVGHKYGQEVATVTANGLQVAVDALETVYTVKQVGAKKLAKRAVKQAGVQTGTTLCWL